MTSSTHLHVEHWSSGTQVIYKYAIPMQGEVTLKMPSRAKIIYADVPHLCGPKMWALVDPERLMVDYKFRVVTTGDVLPDKFTYVLTFLSHPWVCHIFREGTDD